MAQGDQVKNGKAFEYAIAKEYCQYIIQQGRKAVLVENEAFEQAKGYYDSFDKGEQNHFDKAAYETIDTMVKIEPGLLAQKNDKDVLSIFLQKDQEGENGDVRDIVFMRTTPHWEIGFSA
ncbi:MAG: HaeIII family restriction endonuclease, partial [Prevotellaceae bacterium]|nr:HaeIII family restriction endonuclease [Prevotellaceae bacterium]